MSRVDRIVNGRNDETGPQNAECTVVTVDEVKQLFNNLGDRTVAAFLAWLGNTQDSRPDILSAPAIRVLQAFAACDAVCHNHRCGFGFTDQHPKVRNGTALPDGKGGLCI